MCPARTSIGGQKPSRKVVGSWTGDAPFHSEARNTAVVFWPQDESEVEALAGPRGVLGLESCPCGRSRRPPARIEVEKPKAFTFGPTQLTFLQLQTGEGMDARLMSLPTCPTRPHLEYAVRLSDSPYKRAFAALQPGDGVRVFGPIGDFVLREMRPAVLVAGGIGITPLKGMAEYAADKRTARCVIRHGTILTCVPRACGGKPRSHRTRSAPFEPWRATTRPRIWRPSLRAHTTRAPRSSAACSGLARATIVW